MMICHHPENEMLFDYASGSLEEEPSLVVAAHLAFCDLCRGEVRSMESLGGALLSKAADEQTGDEQMAPDALESVMARLDSPMEAGESQPPAPADPILPGPVARYIGSGLDGLRWRRVAPRMEEALIATSNAKFKTSLLRIKAGTVIPRHAHGGREYTLVLKGGIVDEEMRYRRGDVMVADSTHEHRPVAAEDEECICLAVLDAPLRFTGFFARLLSPFLGGSAPR
jgi:putative transcriptional regulator